MVVNGHASLTVKVEYSIRARNGVCSRGANVTVDTVAPGHFMVLRVDSVIRHDKGWSTTSRMSHESFPHGRPEHTPAIEPESLHCEYPLA